MSRPNEKRARPDPDDPIRSTGSKDPADPPGKDPDEYDPVGMSGKKAGVVEQVEQQLDAERQEEDGMDPLPPAGEQGPPRVKNRPRK